MNARGSYRFAAGNLFIVTRRLTLGKAMVMGPRFLGFLPAINLAGLLKSKPV
jgi:hypothetical protein